MFRIIAGAIMAGRSTMIRVTLARCFRPFGCLLDQAFVPLIIQTYLIREIMRPFVPVLAVLAGLFGSFSAAGFLSDAVNGLLPTGSIIQMVSLKVLIALEVLIPISLYLSVLLAFGRLNSDQEITAMAALRVQPERIWRIVLSLCLAMAVVVGALSLFARPWAYARLHALSDQAHVSLNTDAMEAGTFYIGPKGNRVIFFTHRQGPEEPASGVFVQLWSPDRMEIISARQAMTLRPGSPDAKSQILLSDAHIYRFNRSGEGNDEVLDAAETVLDIQPNKAEAAAYSAVATTTSTLLGSSSPADIAELQWRFSTPVSTLLLGLLGIPMSRSKPRQSRYARFGAAILAYFSYYLLCTSARTWVQHGVVPAIPGIWWVPALLGVVLLVLLYGPRWRLALPRRGARVMR
ncbi:Permease [Granulibacter bethesdensis]|nr:Permease [Granulibacter bethesdensis]